MCVVPVDLDLREQWEVHAVIHLAERLDLLIGTGLLVAELVAGEAKHLQAAVLVLGVKRLQPFVLRGEPALARGVDDQQDLALVIAEVLAPAVVQLCGQIVQAHCKCLLGRYFLPRRTRRARRSPKKTTESERQLSKRESDITIDLLWRETLRFPASCERSDRKSVV